MGERQVQLLCVLVPAGAGQGGLEFRAPAGDAKGQGALGFRTHAGACQGEGFRLACKGALQGGQGTRVVHMWYMRGTCVVHAWYKSVVHVWYMCGTYVVQDYMVWSGA